MDSEKRSVHNLIIDNTCETLIVLNKQPRVPTPGVSERWYMTFIKFTNLT